MKKHLFLICSLLLVSLFSHGICAGEESPVTGSLVIVGGGLEPENRDIVMSFITGAMSCRKRAIDEIRIAIIPAGSMSPVDSGEYFKGTLVKYGVTPSNVQVIPVAITDDRSTPNIDEATWAAGAMDPARAREIEGCDGVWFVGGDQARYLATLYDKKGNATPVLQAIWKIYRGGAVLGGTSAGAAIMSDPMIGGGSSLESLQSGACAYTPESDAEGKVSLSQGMGFFPRHMVDQHFNQRGRLGRLIVAALEKKLDFGFGIDENTALVFYARENKIRVAGENGISIIDLRHAEKNVTPQGWEIHHIMLSYIEQGSIYHLDSGKFDMAPGLIEIGKPGAGCAIIQKPILQNLGGALTASLAAENCEKATGIEVALQSDSRARGFLFTFQRLPDSSLYCGMVEGSRKWAALNLRLDIVPVLLEIHR